MKKQLILIFNERFISIVFVVFGLAACTHFPNQNLDPAKNNRSTYQKDLNECKEDHPESSAGLHYSRWIDCMNLKGWR